MHEKAILMVAVPAAALALSMPAVPPYFLLLNTIGTYSLFPLLFRQQEYSIKVGCQRQVAQCTRIMRGRLLCEGLSGQLCLYGACRCCCC